MKSLAALPGLEQARRTLLLSLYSLSTVTVTCPELGSATPSLVTVLRRGTQYLSVGFEYGFHTPS